MDHEDDQPGHCTSRLLLLKEPLLQRSFRCGFFFASLWRLVQYPGVKDVLSLGPREPGSSLISWGKQTMITLSHGVID